MPIKKDGTGKRWVEMEFLTPGTPEQVWQAMATGAGNTAWFTKTLIEERVGGALRFQFGPDVSSSGEVTTWQPPEHFAYVEREWSEGAPPVATEITITARSGGQCVVRMVHSLFSDKDDWDDQLEGFEGGWPGFFAVLRVYLRHFAGSKAASFMVMNSIQGEHLATWKRLQEELGLAGANVGEQRTTASRPEALSGVVELTQQGDKVRVTLLRLAKPVPGMALIGTYGSGERVNVSVSLFLYGDEMEDVAAETERKWRAWLDEKFPSAPA